MTFGSLIRRNDPLLREFFGNRLDELFARTPAWPAFNGEGPWIPPMESYLEKGAYHLRLAVPDLDPKNVSVEVHGNELRISGFLSEERQVPDRHYLTREFIRETFERSVTLPEGSKGEAAAATYEKGVLQITVPLGEKALPRKIEVRSIEPPRKVAA